MVFFLFSPEERRKKTLDAVSKNMEIYTDFNEEVMSYVPPTEVLDPLEIQKRKDFRSKLIFRYSMHIC